MSRISSVVAFLAMSAVLAAALLLLSNLRPQASPLHIWLSAVPLALIGIAYASLQLRLKPNLTTLLKRLLLAGTFILWAVDQFLPPGRLANFVGDFVVSAYVIDLYWIIQEQRGS